ncbi:MAG TPA: hypothetical protein VNM92_11530 [Thermoanaerobaculia bacterium]|nr:hypothetical protein [Thermoanaerobaculia bacterium]
MAVAKKTERTQVWLEPEQIEWLKQNPKGLSVAIRALVLEAMNVDRLRQSVKGAKKKSTATAPAKATKSRKSSR